MSTEKRAPLLPPDPRIRELNVSQFDLGGESHAVFHGKKELSDVDDKFVMAKPVLNLEDCR